VGLWHDLGKYHPEFQRYIAKASGYDPSAHLEGSAGRVDHSTLGAVHAVESFRALEQAGRALAYVIAGHHTGLPDYESDEAGESGLKARIARNRERLAAVIEAGVPDEILSPPRPTSPPRGSPALWIRMLFSALVDADFLDTEHFFDPGRTAARGSYPPLEELHRRFDRYMAKKTAGLGEKAHSTVNRARADVLRQCREKAARKPGLYSLTVPTGGGKTLSSLAWALEHARRNEKQRVIYVIPYTSIIEQTADVFRLALGDDAFLEHHTSIEPERETPESRLATENWDAPLIVTTGVQFWESLFAARTQRARKLHNIVNSVVVLDEAQTLPPAFLTPILDVIRQLQEHYGVSFLLCTATQPALDERRGFDWVFRGLKDVHEIIDHPERLHSELKRVDLHVPPDLRRPVTWSELARDIADEHAVLCIVNRRDDARELYDRLPPESRIHLSALMCGEHRSRTLKEIRVRIDAGERVHVVSTQLVEAGVDLDFPVVYRALAGLDSIAQAAGRCNREGKLRRGRVVVFIPPKPAPSGLLRQAEECGRQSLEERVADPLSPERFRAYFEHLYWMRGDRLDENGILGLLDHQGELKIRFRSAAERFRLIPDNQLPIVVRYENEGLIGEMEQMRARRLEPDRAFHRRLQRSVVSIPRHAHRKLASDGRIAEWFPGVWVQVSPELYHPSTGLDARRPDIDDAADLVG
jgi:CRISPR-associated endonuclease/helicase Cas3